MANTQLKKLKQRKRGSARGITKDSPLAKARRKLHDSKKSASRPTFESKVGTTTPKPRRKLPITGELSAKRMPAAAKKATTRKTRITKTEKTAKARAKRYSTGINVATQMGDVPKELPHHRRTPSVGPRGRTVT